MNVTDARRVHSSYFYLVIQYAIYFRDNLLLKILVHIWIWIGIILLDALKGMFMLSLCPSSMIWGRVKAQTISRPPLTVKTPVQSHISLHGIFGGQNITGQGFFISTSVFPC